jgi:hypothetical protein
LTSSLHRFRGLLRAEIEKVVLFANARLGELSDTIGSLHYSSYEDDQEEMRKKYPSLIDGGMHQLSSSDSDGADSGQSTVSDDNLDDLASSHRRLKSDTSYETKKQIMLRDRLRISKPMFQKADFLGEDFNLLSAVDEVDAYTAVGVELMHLLKYVSVNIIAVRKICRKHDRLLSNRMLGGYYQATETNKSHSNQKQPLFFHLNEARPHRFGGYIVGLYDIKIQNLANSTTMETVSSSLALALADFEASQSRSALLGLGFESSKTKEKSSERGARVVQAELPSKRRQSTRSRLKQAVSYQISGQCFRGGDESTVVSQECQEDENASVSSNHSLIRLRFVVTSIFGLREAARLKKKVFDYYSSRLFLISIGPNVSGDGLNGCSRETLDFLCSYQPDAVSWVPCVSHPSASRGPWSSQIRSRFSEE